MKTVLTRSIAAFALFAVPAWAGTFTVLPLTGDADSGISADKAYTLAIDMGDGANRTINGAVFTGQNGGGTNNFSTTGLTNTLANWPGVNPPGPLVTGATGGLFNNFNYRGDGGSETLTLNNLRIGQEYTTTFYNASWSGPAPRSMNITTSDGGAIVFDQDALPGSLLKYNFVATSNSLTFSIDPNQVASFHQYAFTNEIVGYKALLTDNFFAPDPTNPNTGNLNFNQSIRQGGTVGNVNWVGVNNVQVGNPTGGIDNGSYLLNAFFTGTGALDHNFNGADSAGGLSVSFDFSPNSTGDGNTTLWEAINIGQSAADKNGFINGGHGHFGILFRGNGGIQAFDGNSVVSGAETWSILTNVTNDLHHIEMLITDPTDSNPFDGIGQTDIAVYADGTLVYNFSKGGGGYADNYIDFSNAFIGGADNIMIAQIPEPTAFAMLALGGVALLRRRRSAH